MIRNVSYNNSKIKQEINDYVGQPFGFIQRIKMRGNGSPRFVIENASPTIQLKLALDNNLNYCLMELRPLGVIVGFRSLLESYAWAIPYRKLSVYKTNPGQYSLHADGNFVKIQEKTTAQKKFLTKLTQNRLEHMNGIPGLI